MAKTKPQQTTTTAKSKSSAKVTKSPAKSKMPKASAKSSTKAKGRGTEKKKKGMPHTAVRVLSLTWQSADPNAPKRGLSAYMFFANEQRDTVREENPGISFGKSLSPKLAKYRIALTQPRPGRQGARWQMEGPEREAARAIWEEGRCRQEAIRRWEGQVQREWFPNTSGALSVWQLGQAGDDDDDDE
jgi:hypothetical protein